jgi:ABC-type dipeptide/oligopeptide/nickel transport system permease subunit
VRGQVLSLKGTDFVRASRGMGATTRQILTKHIMPNSMTPVIVSMALGIPGAMFAEAGLSYIGIGVPPPTPSWEQMIGRYQTYIQTYWYSTVFLLWSGVNHARIYLPGRWHPGSSRPVNRV